ncbi:MAG: hypothetical protein IJT19_06175 [Bacteroidaceae bacterium]|nr:hypothetical protein [Bacteroidaceae bacterium]
MKPYLCPQTTALPDEPADFIAVSIIDGGNADDGVPVQARDGEAQTLDWDDEL